MKYISYYGEWQNNLPEGNGIQHFADDKSNAKIGGTYIGQFFKGYRHGLGVWSTKAGDRAYWPTKRDNAYMANWRKDELHGVLTVEDKTHVYQNVIYTHGKCHMPFVGFGPPATGFGTLGRGMVTKRRYQEKHSPSTAKAGSPNAKGDGKREGADKKETAALKGAGLARGLTAARQHKDAKILGEAGIKLQL